MEEAVGHEDASRALAGVDAPREREVLEQRVLDRLVPADRVVGIAPEQHELAVGERAAAPSCRSRASAEIAA